MARANARWVHGEIRVSVRIQALAQGGGATVTRPKGGPLVTFTRRRQDTRSRVEPFVSCVSVAVIAAHPFPLMCTARVAIVRPAAAPDCCFELARSCSCQLAQDGRVKDAGGHRRQGY